ncbi:MAG TPA: flagellar protein FliT [Paraburkholderia sp.]|jgi:hypothetical protein
MDQKTLLERVVELTGMIEQAVSLADWPRASRLAEKRTPLLMELRLPEAAADQEALRRVHATNLAIVENAKTSRSELETEFGTAMQGVRGASEYHRIALF